MLLKRRLIAQSRRHCIMCSAKRSCLAFLLCLTIVLPTISSLASAEQKWNEDGWLRTSIAEDRFLLGDEFGCYGMPHLSTFNDPGAVAQECHSYITERTSASKWGHAPLSMYTPKGLSMAQHEVIKQQGFPVHGDLTGLDVQAWHNDSTPMDQWDWYNLGRRGGSLEQTISDADQLERELERGGLVNMYWIGRVNEATIRHDGDIVDMLENTPTWFTTWGESWSYWLSHRCYKHEHGLVENNGTYILEFASITTDACSSVQPHAWDIPITWILKINQSNVTSVKVDEADFPNIEGQRNTKEGYFQNETNIFISVQKDHKVSIYLDAEPQSYDIVGQTKFWNNHTSALTIGGHATNDLFQWSKRFDDDPFLRFTWLVIPRPLDDGGNWIPFAVIAVGASSVLAMLHFIRKDENNMSTSLHDSKQYISAESERRVDFDERDTDE